MYHYDFQGSVLRNTTTLFECIENKNTHRKVSSPLCQITFIKESQINTLNSHQNLGF